VFILLQVVVVIDVTQVEIFVIDSQLIIVFVQLETIQSFLEDILISFIVIGFHSFICILQFMVFLFISNQTISQISSSFSFIFNFISDVSFILMSFFEHVFGMFELIFAFIVFGVYGEMYFESLTKSFSYFVFI